MARQYSNTSRSMRLLADISAVSPTILVDDATGLPVTFPYNLVIDPDTSLVEVVAVTASSGNTLTISRGQQDTPASAHATAAVVYHAWTALDGQEAQSHFDAAAAVHGVGATANVVGTDTTQVLTNKSISGATNTLTNLPAEQVSGTHKNVVAEGSSAANVPIIAQAIAAQTADVQQWKDESGVSRTRVNSDAELVLSGTVHADGSGTTIEGDVTIDGSLALTGTASTIRAVTTDDFIVSRVTGDTVDRLAIDADGSIHLGPGDDSRDVHIFRDSDGTLGIETDVFISGDSYADGDVYAGQNVIAGDGGSGNITANGTITSTRTSASDNALQARVSTDTQTRFAVEAQGKVIWGPGTGTGPDTNLYRSAADTLKTDDSLHVGNDLTVGSDGTGNLTVNGTADINGAADISGALNVGGALTAANLVCGTVSMNPVANTPTQERVNFGVTLTAPIRVWVTAQSGFIGSQVEGVGVTDLTTTGFDCVIYRTNTTATNVFWLAIGGAV